MLKILPAFFVPSDEELIRRHFDDAVAETAGNISPLYQLDAFDWTILALYFTLLGILAVYGAYRIKQVVDFWRYRHIEPKPAGF